MLSKYMFVSCFKWRDDMQDCNQNDANEYKNDVKNKKYDTCVYVDNSVDYVYKDSKRV